MRRWRGLLFRISIIAALIFAAFWAAGRDDITGRVIVNDGDTITVDGSRIRIFGIDAPELGQTCRDRNRAVYDCGRLAQRQMERLTRSPVTCDVVETDRYERAVAICRSGRTDLGEAMVAAGWARAYLSYSLRYAPAESKARAARRGLWDGEFDDPWAFREDGFKDDMIAYAWRWIMEQVFDLLIWSVGSAKADPALPDYFRAIFLAQGNVSLARSIFVDASTSESERAFIASIQSTWENLLATGASARSSKDFSDISQLLFTLRDRDTVKFVASA